MLKTSRGYVLNFEWIIFSYTLPAEPSSKRVLVWRHLKKLGAVSQAGLWLLPRTETLAAEFETALAEINALGGNALVFHGHDIDQAQHDALRDLYNMARREEYREVQSLCERYLSHIQRLAEAADFRFGAIEEMEQDLEKRRRALAQVKARDAFEVEERPQVENSFRDCERAFDEFVRKAYLMQQGGD
jgi:hypothetical protein